MGEEQVTKHIRTISIASNKPDSKVHSVRMSNIAMWLLILVCCVAVGAIIGVLFFESKLVFDATNDALQKKNEIITLQQEKEALIADHEAELDALALEIAGLEEQIQVLSDTINQRAAEAEAVQAEDAKAHMPTGFPVTGSVTAGEAPEGDDELEMAVYYEATEHAVVVATGSGIVQSIRQNAYEYYEIRVDHGNGYVSIYTNKGLPLLAEGAEVLKGTPMFRVEEGNTLVKYQICQEDVLMDVYDVMDIAG